MFRGNLQYLNQVINNAVIEPANPCAPMSLILQILEILKILLQA